jgi:hypothetical protein
MELQGTGHNVTGNRCAMQVGRAGATWARRHKSLGGIVRIRRAIIIPAILALGVAGSVAAGSAISAAAGHARSTHTQVVAAAPATTYYHD